MRRHLKSGRGRTVAAGLLAGMLLVVGQGTTAGGERPAVRPAPTVPGEAFRGSVGRISPKLRRRMTGSSWHHGCPVPFGRLRLVRFHYRGFTGRTRTGSLVVNVSHATRVLGVMKRLFRIHFRIRRARLVDRYGADDHRSMAADNTSAFNCREIAGRPGAWSEHAYGQAIDLNPVENPWVERSGRVSPPAGARFARRSPRRRGMIGRGGAVVRAFARAGFHWGGDWRWPRDYQHFSVHDRRP